MRAFGFKQGSFWEKTGAYKDVCEDFRAKTDEVSSQKIQPLIRISEVLPSTFYERNTVDVARDLLGKIIVVKALEGTLSGRIVETEAYRGDDPASHSARGLTPRNSVMFGAPGVAYVYFIYGMYEMLNVVTEPSGFPGAVLMRALEPLESLTSKPPKTPSMSGPGRLTRALGISRGDNRISLQGPRLRIIDDGFRPDSISTSLRVGLGLKSGKKHWRFFITGNYHVSRGKENKESRVLTNLIR